METARSTAQTALPPGQRAIDWFPRIGKVLSAPPPAVPEHPMIAITGPTVGSIQFAVAGLADLPRRTMIADFHCVAGFTVRDVHWGGVSFAQFYRSVIEPALDSDAGVTHLCFGGLDGVRATIELADALADDVLVADTLDGAPLDGNHGAPVRIVSSSQYGYMSIKHLCRIEVRTSAPAKRDKMPLLDRLLEAHPRARVWEEERHGSAPSWLIRPLYRAVKGIMLYTVARKASRLDLQRPREATQ